MGAIKRKDECIEFEEEKNALRNRLIQLRMQKGSSARDMSLSLGQNQGYINNIESGKAMPSMNTFFAICHFLEITPQEFFEMDVENPALRDELAKKIDRLSMQKQQVLSALIDSL